jgi:mannose-1-phosphate guanylyltransferase
MENNKMHLVLLSGGSGKRLWPLSNDIRSKQFLKLLRKNDDELESMVQRVYRQLNDVGLSESVTVVAGISQKDQIINQLGDKVNFVSEPSRRDTFPAIALACSYLLSEKNVGLDENVIILPVDPYVNDDYFEQFKDLNRILDTHDEIDIVLLGTEPTYPSEKFGYIIPKESNANESPIAYFKEKPSESVAEELISNGALWNAGVFGIKLRFIIDLLKNKEIFDKIEYSKIYNNYEKLNKNSFDYEVVERTKNTYVYKYSGLWKDLGTWNTLTEEIYIKSYGHVYMSDKCKNTHVINEMNTPIVTLGIEDCVVVSTFDGILVAKKEETPRLKEFIKNYDGRPKYEEKRWGTYQVIDHKFYDSGVESLTKKLVIKNGGKISYQYHNKREEVWTVISGKGLLLLEDEIRGISTGDVIKIAPKIRHAVKGIDSLEIIEIQLGSPLIEDDIVRFEMNW